MRISYWLALGLTACATTASLDTNLQQLIGHDVHDAVTVLGNPSAQNVVGIDTIYTWYATSSVSTAVPSAVATSGFIGAPSGGALEGPSGSMAHSEAACRIRLTVGNDGKIKRFEYRGVRNACDSVSEALQASARKPS